MLPWRRVIYADYVKYGLRPSLGLRLTVRLDLFCYDLLMVCSGSDADIPLLFKFFCVPCLLL